MELFGTQARPVTGRTCEGGGEGGGGLDLKQATPLGLTAEAATRAAVTPQPNPRRHIPLQYSGGPATASGRHAAALLRPMPRFVHGLTATANDGNTGPPPRDGRGCTARHCDEAPQEVRRRGGSASAHPHRQPPQGAPQDAPVQARGHPPHAAQLPRDRRLLCSKSPSVRGTGGFPKAPPARALCPWDCGGTSLSAPAHVPRGLGGVTIRLLMGGTQGATTCD